MAFEAFDRVKEVGYGKFTDIAVHFRDLINFIITILRECWSFPALLYLQKEEYNV